MSAEYEDVGYESGGWQLSEEEKKIIDDQIYTPYELQRLDQFHHIHEQIDHVSEQADKDAPIGWFNKVSKDGKAERKDLIFMMDYQLVRTLHWIALNMWEDFEKSEKMSEAASYILASRHGEKKVEREFNNQELTRIWEWDQS